MTALPLTQTIEVAAEGRPMSEPIVYIDRSTVRADKIEEVERAVVELVDFIEAEEPQLLSYGFHIDKETSRMTVVAVHPDAASVERHMDVGREAFRGFADLIEMEAIEIYGEPSERMLVQLRDKAAALGDRSRVVVTPRHAGFSRLRFGNGSDTPRGT